MACLHVVMKFNNPDKNFSLILRSGQFKDGGENSNI